MRKILVTATSFLLMIIVIMGLLLYNGVIWFNSPDSDDYPIRGVDVSSYQGIIDWDSLEKQGIHFAFIKATEGSSFIDPFFLTNLSNANKTDMRIGAYHFFSYDSSGEKQADNFISVYPKSDNMLPPVVDIEFYGDKEKNPEDRETTHLILNELLLRLEEHYGMKPIIYATKKSYNMYISNYYSEYDVWIRDEYSFPKLNDGRKFTFWQYSHKKKLKGYTGPEKFIDMNVFYGSKEEFEEYGK